ncbi:RNA polymerase-associated LEO1 family protein [Rhodotorula paludigena]|uniref:RNA polymerase-associated LEO1 family protein n=1 Tax=Rhodotorula paludigena TaxID=86838 RepID=UPI00317BB18F
MDPAVDTGYDDGVSEQPNAVNPTSLESLAYGARNPTELYPDAAPGLPEPANPVPGNDSAATVAHGPLGVIAQPLGHLDPSDELPVPPPQHYAQQDPTAGDANDDDEDDDMGDDLFGDGAASDDDAMDEDKGAAAVDEPAQPLAAPSPSPLPDDGLTADERARRQRLEYEEDDYAGAGLDADDPNAHVLRHEEVIAQLPLANFSVPAGGKVWHARLPNFLQIQTSPFDEQTWEAEDLAVGGGAAGESQDDVKPRTLPDENVIRWRWTKDELGQVMKQSNARIVRWSDGTLSLQLGTELFDMSLALDHSATLTASSSGAAVPSVNPVTAGLAASAIDLSRGHGLTYLSARHTYNGSALSEAQASVHGQISFRPATLASQTHRRLAGSIAGRYAAKGRATKLQETPSEDPERLRIKKEKEEADKAKKARREAAKAAGGGRRGGGGGAGRKGKKATTVEGLDISDAEGGDDDEDDEGAYGGGYGGRRSQPKRGRGGPLNRDYSDDDDEGFLARSDEEEEEDDNGRDAEIEEADAVLEERRRKDRSSKRRGSDAGDESQGTETAAAPRRRLVVESDEDE